MRIIIENADSNDFNELAKLAREGKIHSFCMTDEEEWIPVSERLPEEGKSVLVCIKTQGGMSQYVSERFNGNNWSALGGRTPIAWQLLPKPYKRGEE